ncbi:MAG: MFS transporter [Pseudomonadota bacterium]
MAVLLGLTGGLGSALVTVNLGAIQGELALDPVQGAWLSAAYVMVYISMNLLLVKYRQQFGLRRFVTVFLGAYAVAATAHLFTDSFASALIVRGVSGVTGAALTAVTMFYMFQALPPRFKMQALLMGIGISQLGIPLTRIISPELLDVGDWHRVYALEAGLALTCLAGVTLFRVPPGIRIQVFEPRDAPSFVLLSGGFALLVAAASLGRVSWWFDTPWIGWALAGAVVLIAVAAVLEHYRTNPLIDTRWLVQPGFLRFAISILVARMLLSEQAYAAPGMLQALGMGPDQMRGLFTVVLIATVIGMLVGAFSLLLSPKLVVVQALAALALIAVGAFMDARATVETHPANLYVSQGLIGFASTLFICSITMLGIGQLLQRGFQSMVTFTMVQGVTQILGGVLGSAAFSTFQAVRLQHHMGYLSDHLTASDPQIAWGLQAYGRALAPTVTDPVLRTANGVQALGQAAAQQATILAYNDVFLLIGAIASVQLVLSAFLLGRAAGAGRLMPAPPPAPAPAST